jgi:hypothetical protein
VICLSAIAKRGCAGRISSAGQELFGLAEIEVDLRTVIGRMLRSGEIMNTKSLWFVEAMIIGMVLFVVGYMTLPDVGLAASIGH